MTGFQAKSTLAWLLKDEVVRRFQSKTRPAANGCIEWAGAVQDNGYGRFGITDKYLVPAHRFAYELAAGEIPPGMSVDHLCRNRICVNPSHLEVVSIGVNILRGDAPSARNRRKTHCKQGHAFTPENIYRTSRGRECLTCMGLRSSVRGKPVPCSDCGKLISGQNLSKHVRNIHGKAV